MFPCDGCPNEENEPTTPILIDFDEQDEAGVPIQAPYSLCPKHFAAYDRVWFAPCTLDPESGDHSEHFTNEETEQCTVFAFADSVEAESGPITVDEDE